MFQNIFLLIINPTSLSMFQKVFLWIINPTYNQYFIIKLKRSIFFFFFLNNYLKYNLSFKGSFLSLNNKNKDQHSKESTNQLQPNRWIKQITSGSTNHRWVKKTIDMSTNRRQVKQTTGPPNWPLPACLACVLGYQS